MNNRLSRAFTLAALCALASSLAAVGVSLAAEARPPRSQAQMDATIVWVDKYGVYVPNVIFYWDEGMSKQKMESLKRLAEKSRNRKAVITYSAVDDLSKDKRPLLVDLVVSKEEPKPLTASREPAQAEQQPEPSVEQPVEQPADSLDANTEPDGQHLWNQAMKRDEPAPPPADPRVFERPPSPQAPSAPEPDGMKASISREEVAGMVRRILSLNERKDVAATLSHYADQVNYYDRGNVDRDYIRKDMGYYFRNWDTIHSTLEGEVVMIVTGEPDTRIVKFVSAYTVQNAKRTATGRTENIWKVKRVHNDLKIVDVKQRIIRNEPQ